MSFMSILYIRLNMLKKKFLVFEYMKDGGVIFFDDVDSGPYMTGQRKRLRYGRGCK